MTHVTSIAIRACRRLDASGDLLDHGARRAQPIPTTRPAPPSPRREPRQESSAADGSSGPPKPPQPLAHPLDHGARPSQPRGAQARPDDHAQPSPAGRRWPPRRGTGRDGRGRLGRRKSHWPAHPCPPATPLLRIEAGEGVPGGGPGGSSSLMRIERALSRSWRGGSRNRGGSGSRVGGSPHAL